MQAVEAGDDVTVGCLLQDLAGFDQRGPAAGRQPLFMNLQAKQDVALADRKIGAKDAVVARAGARREAHFLP